MPEKTLDLFEQMSVNPNDIIHTIVFNACALLANERSMSIGKKLLNQISNELSMNNNLWASGTHMLIKFGDIKRAEDLFQSLQDKDIFTYAFMMKVYNLNKQPLKTLQLFQNIKQQNLVPDSAIFNSCINACSQLGILRVCQSLVAQIPSHLQTDSTILNTLIDMWASAHRCTFLRSCFVFLLSFQGKSGSVEKAQEIFQSIDNPTTVTYNSMSEIFHYTTSMHYLIVNFLFISQRLWIERTRS